MTCSTGAWAAVTMTGQLFTWGEGTSGRLGHGDEVNYAKPTLVKSLVHETVSWASMGTNYLLLLTDKGTVYSCGVAMQSEEKKLQPMSVASLAGKKITKVVAGHSHNAAISADGDLFCWGQNSDGQLGLGDCVDRNSPTLVQGLVGTKIIDAALGTWHTIALSASGNVFTFGANCRT